MTQTLLQNIAQIKADRENLTQELDARAKALLADFQAYITNRDIALADRWLVFFNADSIFRVQSHGLPHFKTTGMKEIYDHNLSNCDHYGKGAIVELMKDMNRNYFKNEKGTIKLNLHGGYMEEYEVVDAIEEVLSLRLESYSHDW